VTVPHHDFTGAAFEEALDGRVDLARQELPHFGILGLGLVLPADAGDALGVGNHEDPLTLG
jgi:hypothetical protein